MKNKLIHNTIVLLVAMIITKIVGAIFRIPLANILGGTGMGYYSSAYGLFTPVFAITAAGIPTAMINLVSANVSKGQYLNAQKIKRVALRLFTVIGIVGTVFIFVFAKFFTDEITHLPHSFIPILIIAPSILLCCVGGVYRGYFEGLNMMHPTAYVQVIEACARAVFGLSLSYLTLAWANSQYEESGIVFGAIVNTYEKASEIALPYAAAAAVLGVTLSEVAAFVFLLIRSRFFSDGISKKQLASNNYTQSGKSITKSLVKQAVPIAISSMVINLISFIDLITVTRGIDNAISANRGFFVKNYQFALDAAGGLDGLGVFMYGSYTGLAASLFMMIPAVASMLDKSVLPNISAAHAIGDKVALSRNINIVFRGTMLMGLPLCFGLGALAEPIIQLLYSSRPAESVIALPLVQTLGWFGMFLILSSVLFTIFQSVGRADLPIKLMIFGVVVKWLGNILLVSMPQFNILGATISTMLCYFLVFVIGFVILVKEVKMKINMPSLIVKPLISALLCAGSAFMSSELIKLQSNLLTVLVSMAVGAIIYILALFLTGAVSVDDIKRIKK